MNRQDGKCVADALAQRDEQITRLRLSFDEAVKLVEEQKKALATLDSLVSQQETMINLAKEGLSLKQELITKLEQALKEVTAHRDSLEERLRDITRPRYPDPLTPKSK
jgi:phage-related minor tail protein